MHPYHLRWHRYRRLLAAVMTLPDLDVATPVLHEFSGQWPCCFNGCAEAGRYAGDAARPWRSRNRRRAGNGSRAARSSRSACVPLHGIFARSAVPQPGLGSLVRLVVLLQQYGPDEDTELALLLWQGEIAPPAFANKRRAAFAQPGRILQSQSVTDAASWLKWRFGRCASGCARCTASGARYDPRFTLALGQRTL